MHGETPQDAVRGGSPRSRGKRAIPRSPHPLNKSLETESSTILPVTLISYNINEGFQNSAKSFIICNSLYNEP
ncbi:hypothetical protein DYE48_19000 [Halobacillus trueperi]|uniref:Uncharacterized protein n=1 Tax=Halobacillus trueperi TaxID=156205 RepID=A0A3E0J087_9BACI|nr:hypothetical protein DYE48_19000 [Halobacillus trueperi]